MKGCTYCFLWLLCYTTLLVYWSEENSIKDKSKIDRSCFYPSRSLFIGQIIYLLFNRNLSLRPNAPATNEFLFSSSFLHTLASWVYHYDMLHYLVKWITFQGPNTERNYFSSIMVNHPSRFPGQQWKSYQSCIFQSTGFTIPNIPSPLLPLPHPFSLHVAKARFINPKISLDL